MNEELLTNVVEIQRKLSTLIGAPGREDRVREFIYATMKRFSDDVIIDRVGNVIAEIKGSNPDGVRIQVDAHMDEIALMIRYIDPKGFLRFSPLGGIDKRLYPGSKVLIQSEKGGEISGIIGMPPPHITSPAEREKSPDYLGLFIDVGAESEEQVKNMGIDIGSIAILDATFEYTPDLGIMRGKAFDDRTGCNVILQVAKLLSENPPIENTVIFTFTYAEETGISGAGPAAFATNPDLAIVLENTIAADVPGVPSDKSPTSLGNGPSISVADRMTVYDARLLKLIKQTANNINLKWQYKLPTFGGTNAGIIHKTGNGIPSLCISVPCRYIHSAYGQLKVQDILDTITLVHEFLKNPIELRF